MTHSRTLAAASAALAALLLGAVVALAHNGMHNAWMDSLERPDGGGKCCFGGKDCLVTQARIGGARSAAPGSWEALSPRGWVSIPEEKIIRGQGNPTGEAVLCWLPWDGVRCFVAPPGS